MSWDEQEFLDAIKTYLLANVDSGTLVWITPDPEGPSERFYNMSPPFIAFKDGTTINQSFDEHHIRTTINLNCVVQILHETSGPVVGRLPIATYWGVVYLTKKIQTILTLANVQDGITLTNSRIDGCHWVGLNPSVNHMESSRPVGGRNWQSKIITFEFEISTCI